LIDLTKNGSTVDTVVRSTRVKMDEEFIWLNTSIWTITDSVGTETHIIDPTWGSVLALVTRLNGEWIQVLSPQMWQILGQGFAIFNIKDYTGEATWAASKLYFGFYYDASNFIYAAVDFSLYADYNFRFVSNVAGAPSAVDTGVLHANNTPYKLCFQHVPSTSNVTLYINGVSVGTLLCNGQHMSTYIRIENADATNKTYGTYIDRFYMDESRPE
jgi:hypothetical protein